MNRFNTSLVLILIIIIVVLLLIICNQDPDHPQQPKPEEKAEEKPKEKPAEPEQAPEAESPDIQSRDGNTVEQNEGVPESREIVVEEPLATEKPVTEESVEPPEEGALKEGEDARPEEVGPPQPPIPTNVVEVNVEGIDGPLFVVDRSKEIEDMPESPAGDAEPEARAWGHAVREIGREVREACSGELRVVNFAYIDSLVHVRGAKRGFARFVPPKSSNLCLAGVYVYDTTKLPDNRLYLVKGPQASPWLHEKGEQLLRRMHEQSPSARIEIVEAKDSPIWKRMIHQIGGADKMLMRNDQIGDEILIEHQFFRTGLHLFVFEPGSEVQHDEVKVPSLDLLPAVGAAIVDCGDNMIYLYCSQIDDEDESPARLELRRAIVQMNETAEWKKRQVLIFDRANIPPQLALTFGLQ